MRSFALLAPTSVLALALALALALGACTGNKPSSEQPTTGPAGAEPAHTDAVFIEAQPSAGGQTQLLAPEIAGLFRCWFRSPYEYMFDPGRGQLQVGSRSYGMLMAGISGMLVYSGLNDCAGEIVGQAPRSYSDIAPLEIMAGVPATLPGQLPFATVNPEFVLWARRTLLPDSQTSVDGVIVQEAYDQVFSRFFRLMAESALLLHERYDIAGETRTYLADTDAGADGIDWLENHYGHELRDHGGSWDGTTMTPAMAMGFWLRRQADTSIGPCWHAIRDVVAHYDPQWLDEQRGRYPKGWATLAANPDPLAGGTLP
ncbi:MAG: hypothetical protein KC457_24135 [Myxococcales bacterium]|nr:hypothetical protein [Myxococcales bacterium]